MSFLPLKSQNPSLNASISKPSIYDKKEEEDSKYNVSNQDFIALESSDESSSSEQDEMESRTASLTEDGEIIENFDVHEEISEEPIVLRSLEPTMEQLEAFDAMATKVATGRYFTEVQDTQTKKTKCYYCRKVGHVARDCEAKILGADLCLYCDEQHDPTMCPFASEVCFLCGCMGHRRRDCPNMDKPEMRSPRECLQCHDKTHSTLECTAIWRQYRLDMTAKHYKTYDTIVKYCYNCGYKGHFGDDCPRKSYGRNSLPSVFTKDIFARVEQGRKMLKASEGRRSDFKRSNHGRNDRIGGPKRSQKSSHRSTPYAKGKR